MIMLRNVRLRVGRILSLFLIRNLNWYKKHFCFKNRDFIIKLYILVFRLRRKENGIILLLYFCANLVTQLSQVLWSYRTWGIQSMKPIIGKPIDQSISIDGHTKTVHRLSQDLGLVNTEFRLSHLNALHMYLNYPRARHCSFYVIMSTQKSGRRLY